jgi:hypothetical protein
MSLHLSTHNILAKQQFGFRNNSPTALATYNLLDNIYVALNGICIAGGIFCDLSKAFDRVNHILLSEMELKEPHKNS